VFGHYVIPSVLMANVARYVYFACFIKDNHRVNKRNLKNLSHSILFYFSLNLLKKFICKLHCFSAVCQIRPKTFKVSTNPRWCPNCHKLLSPFYNTYSKTEALNEGKETLEGCACSARWSQSNVTFPQPCESVNPNPLRQLIRLCYCTL